MTAKSNTIKLSPGNFQAIAGLRRGGDHYDDVVTRLLAVYRWAQGAARVLEGNNEFKQFQKANAAGPQGPGGTGEPAPVSDVPGDTLET